MRRVTPGREYRRVMVWMRRALRVQDNGPLWHALQDSSEVIPVVCLRDDGASRTQGPRQRYVRSALADLEQSLRQRGSGLLALAGDPSREIPAAAVRMGAEAVYAAKLTDPASLRRDGVIARRLEQEGKTLHLIKDRVLFEEREVLNANGEPYRVFTPYRRAFLDRASEIPRPFPAPRRIPTPPDAVEGLSLGRPGRFERLSGEAGESAALKRLERFLRRSVTLYGERRDIPAMDGTSRLSAPLSHGALSIRTVYWAAMGAMERAEKAARKNIDLFISQLVWREFYYQIMANFPHVIDGPFKEEFARVPWRHSRRHLEAWRSGLTGYPLIDAAMRQLAEEGWMHNRARMIVGSFLTKDLHINWQEGEGHFRESLADLDLALNNGGWQWVAGTGTDASPWFRVFNPVLQGKKFDPDGSYVRTYVPELRNVPVRFIHMPWAMSPEEQHSARCFHGKTYPRPIVDHAVERGVTLELYGRRRGTSKTLLP